MCSVYSWNERTEKSRENIYIGLCLRKYIQNSGRKHLFSFSEFFFSFLMLYWIAYWYPIVVNVLLHVFVFGSMLFFFLSSFVVRYIFSQYRKSASKFFYCVCICVRKPRMFWSKYIEIKYLCKERVSKFQSCKHGNTHSRVNIMVKKFWIYWILTANRIRGRPIKCNWCYFMKY